MNHLDVLENILKEGADKTRVIASETLQRIRKSLKF